MDWFGDYTVPLERIAWGCFESILDLCVVFLRSKGSFFLLDSIFHRKSTWTTLTLLDFVLVVHFFGFTSRFAPSAQMKQHECNAKANAPLFNALSLPPTPSTHVRGASTRVIIRPCSPPISIPAHSCPRMSVQICSITTRLTA